MPSRQNSHLESKKHSRLASNYSNASPDYSRAHSYNFHRAEEALATHGPAAAERQIYSSRSTVTCACASEVDASASASTTPARCRVRIHPSGAFERGADEDSICFTPSGRRRPLTLSGSCGDPPEPTGKGNPL